MGDKPGAYAYELSILRKGGVSEQSINNTIRNSELLQGFNILVSARPFAAFQEETQAVEGPG